MLLDCAGNPAFQPLIDAQVQDATVLLLIFDVASRASMDHCEAWLNHARDVAKTKHICSTRIRGWGRRGVHSTLPLDLKHLALLIGAKADEDNRREVATEEAQAFAEALSAAYFECSAVRFCGLLLSPAPITSLNIPLFPIPERGSGHGGAL